MTIENTLRGMGVQWLRTVHNYRVGAVRDALQAGDHHAVQGAEGGHRRRANASWSGSVGCGRSARSA